MAYSILIVEDEEKLRDVLTDYFRSKGDSVLSADNGIKALELLKENEFDAVLLDIMMPELDGFGVCRAVRKKSGVPIIFLTALSDEEDKLKGYEIGADDYVTKPFTMSVLYAKTSALINRARGDIMLKNKLKAGNIILDIHSKKVCIKGLETKLSPKEYSLLYYLMSNKNIVLSRDRLLEKCWGYDFEGDSRVVDTHIKRLREKLGREARCIRTVIKYGYMMEE